MNARSRFEGQIYPGVSINRVDVSGLRTDEAEARLQDALQTATKARINLSIRNDDTDLAPSAHA